MRCEHCRIHDPVIHLSGADGRLHRLCASCLREDPSLVRAALVGEADPGADADMAFVDRFVERLLRRLPEESGEPLLPKVEPDSAQSTFEEREAWRERLKRWCPGVHLLGPASVQEIGDVERSLDVALPSDLRHVLSASNGVRGPQSTPVWSTRTLAEANRLFRSELGELYMSFSSLLFFGDAGDGDQYAFRVVNGEVDGGSVYVWNHRDDSRVWAAPCLEAFLEAHFSKRKAA
ncbi:MAG: SMI1/KNR4 family protein [Vicinamibacterales bacterium]